LYKKDEQMKKTKLTRMVKKPKEKEKSGDK
jgi:hypothetical protein